ncbi:MAG: DUF4249 family protein [Bacteroidota bacterium]
MRLLCLALLTLALAGCDGTVDDDFTPQLVVSAFLGTAEPLPDVRLSQTSPLLAVLDTAALGVDGAEVSITLLAPDGSDEETYPYALAGPGRYSPVGADTVRELRTYRLDVTGPGGEQLTAQTTVPPDYDLVNPAPDDRDVGEVIYGLGLGPEVEITRSSTDDRLAAFVGSVRALAPDDFEEVEIDGETRYRSLNLPDRFRPVSLFQRFLDCEEDDEGRLVCEEDPLQDFVVTGTSPVLNEASYVTLPNGNILVRVPFLAFGYLGPQDMTLVSLDPAFQAFLQTQAIQGGGSTLSPGEIPNVTSNVEGGLGVFGSFSAETVQTTIVASPF